VAVRRIIRDIGEELLAFEDSKTFKAWLKTWRRQPRMVAIDDLPL
jgi:hypothetical protein